MTRHRRKDELRPEQAERLEQWSVDRERRTPDGRRLWRCWHCDQLAPWGPTWGWYGSWKELDDGVPIVVFCSEECRAFLAIKKIVPRLNPAEAVAS